MKLIAAAGLSLVAARPQFNLGNGVPGNNVQLDDLGALGNGLDGVSGLGLDDIPDLTVNQSEQLLDAVVDAVASKKPMPALVDSDLKHADAINDKIKEVYEKYEAAWDKKQEFIADTEAKVQKAQDKHASKVDRVIAHNNKFAAAHQKKKEEAEAKKQQFADDTADKKKEAQEHKQKVEDKHNDKKDKNTDQKQKAQDKKEAVQNNADKKKQNALVHQQKKDEKEDKKNDKAAHMKKVHYHKVIAECWKQLKQVDPDLGMIKDAVFDNKTFEGLDGCMADLQEFSDWDKVKDWFAEKPMNKPMDPKPEGQNKQD